MYLIKKSSFKLMREIFPNTYVKSLDKVNINRNE